MACLQVWLLAVHFSTGRQKCGLSKSYRANLTAEQVLKISRELTSPAQRSLSHGRGSIRVLNTEISWYGAGMEPHGPDFHKRECKICACKTKLLNWFITSNKGSHSKENFKEIIAKISYFSHQPLTSCHIGRYFLKNLTLPGHFP